MSNPAVTTKMYQDAPAAYIEEDEINLNEIFSKVWRRRRFITFSVATVILFVLGVAAFSYLMNPPIKEYSISVRFNFPSSAQGQYPAGQVFSNNDLISSVILKQVFNANNIESQGVGFEKFAAAFSIAPFAENTKFIQTKYDKLLSNKNLTRTDIEGLEKQYINEMNAAQAGFAKIKYIDSARLGLSPVVIEKVLNDIPKVWSEISIRDLGVLDLKIPGKQFYQPELIDQYEYLQATQYMLDSSQLFSKMLQVLEKDNVGGFIRDPKTGLVVADISSRLKSLERFDLVPVISVISNLGLVKNKTQARLYLINQVQLLQDQQTELTQKIRVYKEAMLAYASRGRGADAKAGSSTSAMTGGMVQYGDGFLSRIVGMVEEKKETEYRQSLLDKQISFSIKLQEIAIKQEKLRRALAVIDKKHHQEKKVASLYESKIKQINQGIITLVGAYQNILESRNLHVLGKNSALYAIDSANMAKTSGLRPKMKTALLSVLAFAFFALMLSVMIALMVKEKERPAK